MALGSLSVTEGVGRDVAVDTIAAREYQIIKLALGAEGALDMLLDSGQQTMALSLPVVIASDQSAIAVTLAAGDLNIGNVDVVSLPALPAGTNNIGDVDVLSLPALPAGTNNIGDVDVLTLPALPAGTNLIGKASVAQDTATIYNGTTALTPKFAVISGATNGNNTLVAAVADKKVRVLALMLMAAGTVTVTLQTGAGGTALTGALALTAQTGFCLPFNPAGWMETGVNTLLNMALNAAIQVSGCLTYVEV